MFDKFPELHTERLELVEITQSHLSDFYEIFRDERAAKYYNIIPFKKKEEAQKYIDWFQSRYKDSVGIRWGIRLKDKSSIIGTAGFNNYQKDHRANLGYDLHVDYWNKGYITEALSEILNFGFNTLAINRIEAEVMQGNVASEKVLEKLGFTKEGILREWMYWNNQYYDMTMLSLLKKELIPQIEKGKSEDYKQLLAVWESSVKATHHFLKQEDFEFYKKIVPDFFSQVELFVLRSGNAIVAFMGIFGDNLEMLFVSGKARSQGYGKLLLEYAIDKLNVTKVGVNEGNKQAIGFYEKFGFKTVSRSEKDSMGKYYPILHLSL